MKKQASAVRNSSSVSIRKAAIQKYVTDANQREKAQQPILSFETLRSIGRIVRAIRNRIRASPESDENTNEFNQFDTGTTTVGRVGSEDC
jgi:hypothetical protein